MSELHDLCRFQQRPIDEKYLESLKYYLSNGVPATYTLEEVENYELNEKLSSDEPKIPLSEDSSNTTPLHLICANLPKDATSSELEIVFKLVEELFDWGAGWNLMDDSNQTPGDILNKRGFRSSAIYDRIVDAGVSAEILLRKINNGDLEFLSDDEIDQDMINFQEQDQEQDQVDEPEQQENTVTSEDQLKEQKQIDKYEKIKQELIADPANTQETYLKTKLEYSGDSLITKDNKDGVMMEWENELMKAGCDTIFQSVKELQESNPKDEDLTEVNVLNIGFGMGIIDTLIQAKFPTNHYICEAHPDVLNKLEQDGWLEKPNVTVLKGRWQEVLPGLLNSGVFFNGIYYDTYSEHYSDMLDLFDLIVGLLKPSGIFSFFNGLGADRQVIYDVYKKIVEIDLNNYGLTVKYTDLEIPALTREEFDDKDESVWNGIKRAYWRCDKYYHPEIRFV